MTACVPLPHRVTEVPELTGNVFDSGTPVAGAELLVSRNDREAPCRNTVAIGKTSADGSFRVEEKSNFQWFYAPLVAPITISEYALCISVSGLAVLGYRGGVLGGSAQPISLACDFNERYVAGEKGSIKEDGICRLTGCALNDVVKPLPTGSAVTPGRAVIVYGVGVEGKWNYSGFAVQLDEYSVENQTACPRNRTSARVPSVPGQVRYFAFEVPPGHYAYSANNGAPLLEDDRYAFAAPEGHIVYAGDFVFSRDQRVVVRRDLAALLTALDKSFPDLEGDVSLAKGVKVQQWKR